MAVVVAVTDGPEWGSNTDVIVVVDPDSRRLLWVPRDLWSPSLRHRVNKAFARGRHDALREALAEHDIRAEHSLCLRREATERALRDAVVTVPVRRRMVFRYPWAPGRPIEDGSKVVIFRPPEERLEGERIHQWLGSRKVPHGFPPCSDFARIERQKIFLRCLWEQGFDFASVLEDPGWVSMSDPQAVDQIALAEPTWRFETLDDVEPGMREGMSVLVRR